MILKINGKQFDHFNQLIIDLKYNAVASTFDIKFFFDPDLHKDLHDFRKFPLVSIEHNNERILTGRIISHVLPRSAAKKQNTVAGYSLAGILEDTNIPLSLFPLQTDGNTLKGLCEDLSKPFGINVVVDAAVAEDAGGSFEQITADETDTVKGFLADIAAQKNIVLSHTSFGALFLTKAKTTGTPVLDIDEGGIPDLAMSLKFSGQGMHKTLVVLKDSDPAAGAADEVTATNPFVSIEKSMNKVMTSGADADLASMAKTALGQDLRNISLTLDFDRLDPNGKIIRPNQIITVRDPQLMMSKKVRWFVDHVRLTATPKSLKSTITCFLPESLNGDVPSYIFDT